MSKYSDRSTMWSDHSIWIWSTLASKASIWVPASRAARARFRLSRPLQVKLIFTSGYSAMKSSAAAFRTCAWPSFSFQLDQYSSVPLKFSVTSGVDSAAVSSAGAAVVAASFSSVAGVVLAPQPASRVSTMAKTSSRESAFFIFVPPVCINMRKSSPLTYLFYHAVLSKVN